MESQKPHRQWAAVALTVLGALLRLVPHPPNFAPIGGTGLFAGSRLRAWQAYLVPLAAMALTDPIRSWMEGGFPAYTQMTLVIYASMLIYVFLGQTLLRKSQRPGRIAAVCLLGSTQFFLVTNFFVWLGHDVVYAHTFAGLMACYTEALPFFGWTVAGDLFYTAVLTVAYLALIKRQESEAATTHA
ncbi:MAG TPA: DUF6580 family putative transport protein [Bryobacteraceae bacterium]|nr:DUF6580 family putative transport protein [Bryobacteraceae bacterium]